MDRKTYHFVVEMSKEEAERFKDHVHSLSIYYNGHGKTAYCFREIKPSNEIDRKVFEWIREKGY